jgi:glycosyltransferase involved in cell wall biosynthesis
MSKILMFVFKLNLGGTEHYVLNLARSLRTMGVDVGVATTGGPLVNKFRKSGIPIHLWTGTPGSKSPVSNLSAIIRKHNYQIFHAHDSEGYRLAALLYRQFKIPVIATVLGRYHVAKHLQAAAKVARNVIVISPSLREWTRELKLPSRKITYIPIGIDTRIFHPLDSTACRKNLHLPIKGQIIAYASRLYQDKYPIARCVIEAGGRIALIHRHFSLVVVGPGPYRRNLQQLASRLNKQIGRRAIKVIPALDNIRELYNAADAVVGTGSVASEAMACGKPVIAAGIKGYMGIVLKNNISKAIKNHFGDHGGITPVRVNHLVRDMNLLLNSPASRLKALGRMGRAVSVQRYSLTKVSKRIYNLYQQNTH